MIEHEKQITDTNTNNNQINDKKFAT